MRPRLHFDGQPDTCERMRKLFAPVSRLRVVHAEPKWSKFMLLVDAKGNSLIRRAWSRLRRTA